MKVLEPLPPHRIPTRFAWSPVMIWNTGERPVDPGAGTLWEACAAGRGGARGWSESHRHLNDRHVLHVPQGVEGERAASPADEGKRDQMVRWQHGAWRRPLSDRGSAQAEG